MNGTCHTCGRIRLAGCLGVPGRYKKAVYFLIASPLQTRSMLLPIPFANLALSLLNRFFPQNVSQHPHVRPPNDGLNFHLRHVHAATSSAHVYLSDVPHERSTASGFSSTPLSILTSPIRTTRPSSLDAFAAARHMSKRGQSAILDWEEDEVPGPDVTRRETLLLLAKMTSNTYFKPGTKGWYNLTEEWDVVRHVACVKPFVSFGPDFYDRVCQLDGSLMMTAFEGTSLRRRTTAPSHSLSRVHHLRSSMEALR